MRVIQSSTGYIQYKKIFNRLVTGHSEIVLWQVSQDSGKRFIFRTKITDFSFESQKILLPLDSNVILSDQLVIYAYASEDGFIFKSSILEIRESTFYIKLPEEIKFLEGEEVINIKGFVADELSNLWIAKGLDLGSNNLGSDVWRVKSMAQRSIRDQELLNHEFNMSLDEEDKIFAGLRESPRARAKENKWVKVSFEDSSEFGVFKLYDLSRGGLGFICSKESEFKKGLRIKIIGFNDFDLDDPILGEVMSLRPVDESQIEFKVGVKFYDGQN
jgi:hypothetical protein